MQHENRELARHDPGENCTEGPALQMPPGAYNDPKMLMVEQYKSAVRRMLEKEIEQLEDEGDPDWRELEEEFAQAHDFQPLGVEEQPWEDEQPLMYSEALAQALKEVNEESAPEEAPPGDPPEAADTDKQ